MARASILSTARPSGAARDRRTLSITAGAHALHDGYTDLLYVLLPVWQAEFGLGYGEVGALRALYTGTMAGFQVPAGSLADRFGGPLVLAAGTALAAAGYLLAGVSGSFLVLAVALVVGGLGSSTQHPIGSSLVAQAYEGPRSRMALGTYNFSGDLGKMALPAATAWMITLLPWRSATIVLGILGLLVAVYVLLLPRRFPSLPKSPDGVPPAASTIVPSRRGFHILQSIGMIDSATRMGFLTFLPFLLVMKGAEVPTIGLALALVFFGGAFGKLACGYLGDKLGVLATVFLTEGITAVGILALLPLSLTGSLALLPIIGVALNGTSSVLYGTIPELVLPERRARAFGIFYTSSIGAGAASPVIYGMFSDALGIPAMMALTASIVVLTLPLAWMLRPILRRIAA